MPVGKKLAAERRSQGKTLAEIMSATKIMSRALEALENERWDQLPAAPYVKGYIQSYAQALGLDARPFLEEYARDMGQSPEARSDVVLESIPKRQVVPHRHEAHAIPPRAIATVVAVIVVVLLALWGISALGGGDEAPPPMPPETAPAASAPATSAPTDEAQGSRSATTPQGAPDAFELSVSVPAGRSVWMSVLVDGLVAYEGTLPGGESKSWTVTDAAVVRVEDPTSVVVSRDGEEVPFPRAREGGVAELTLTAAR